jgi:hypothetical protein
MRWLAEDFIFYLPFIGAFMNRIGAVRACQENAERLLREVRLGRIEFGEPIRPDGYGPEAADDSLLVGRLTEKLRSTIQGMLDRSVADRQSVWFG